MTTATHHDLLVLGSGSGNSLVTPEMAGWSVGIVEEGIFGGTCLNVGCIPTKMFVLPADRVAEAHEAARIDVTVEGARADWAAARDRIFGRIDPISEAGAAYRRDGEGTTLHQGRGRFVGPREVEVTAADGSTTRVTADRVVIATGSRPWVPEPFARALADGLPVHTSDTVMRIGAAPRRALVVGGGYIATEMAHVLSGFGAAITLVVRGPQLLRDLDPSIAIPFDAIATDRWDVRHGTTVDSLERLPGADAVRAHLSDGTTVEIDLVLVATGRVPNSDDLGLERAGVATHPDGRIVVDVHGRTGADGVWSLGDVSSPFQLKHVANAEARVVAHNLVHPDDLHSFSHDVVPAAVFGHPQIATVGDTVAQARERILADGGGVDDVLAHTQAFGSTAYGWALEDTESLCTVVADRRSGLLLGAHLMGPQASTLIQPLVQAMSFGLRAADVARGQYWIHPALTEVVENALLGLED